ncbi:hypothetical protein TRVA0_057S00826 [Trichomonascus vanleenenianus]|uniref:uncharacterized protein n=1 Tax=Trichomonascus vanleenenianus TaxID=2268995 RepID=UPI003EC9804D
MSNTSATDAPQQQPDSQEVGWIFIEKYYTFLNNNPSKLHLFYTKNSVICHGVEGETIQHCKGQSQIQKQIKEHNFQDCKVMVSNVDSLPSADGGVILQVLGEMSNRGGPSQKFVQTFFLATQPQGYYVMNDIFRFLKEDVVDYEEEEQESGVNGHHESSLFSQEISSEAQQQQQQQPQPQPQQPQEPEEATPQEEAKPVAAETETKETETKQEEEVKEQQAEPAVATSEPEPAVAEEPTPEQQATPEPAEPPKPIPAVPAGVSWAARLKTSAPAPKEKSEDTSAAHAAPASPTPTPSASISPTTSATAASPSAAAAAAAANGSGSSKGGKKPEFHSAYLKHVTFKVDDVLLKKALDKIGKVTHFQVEKSKQCAFVDFVDAETLKAALDVHELRVGDQVVLIEERKRGGAKKNKTTQRATKRKN